MQTPQHRPRRIGPTRAESALQRARHSLLPIAALVCISAQGRAQSTLDHPVGERAEFPLVSGALDNDGPVQRVVYAKRIVLPQVTWMRLYFRETRLAEGSFIRLTAHFDGEVQELDASALSMWSDSSAYFNGGTVTLELHAGARTRGNRVSLDHLVVGPAGPSPSFLGSCGICGADDRFPSNEDWSGRIMDVGCTGSVWSTESCVVSAGHCMGAANVIQFRVPPSNPDCSLNHPPIADQFPITQFEFDSNGIGDDWAVLATGTNNLDEKPFERYGAMRPIAGAPANVGNPVNVWGFGVDSQCVRSQTQQDSDGGFVTLRAGTYYEYEFDITFGNSGSALIKDGEIVGIVSHCSLDCPNFATRVDNPDFVAARDGFCASCPAPDPSLIYVDAAHAGTSNGSQSCPFKTVAEGVAAVAAGGVVEIRSGSYPEQLNLIKAVRLRANGGAVTLR